MSHQLWKITPACLILIASIVAVTYVYVYILLYPESRGAGPVGREAGQEGYNKHTVSKLIKETSSPHQSQGS